MNLTPVWERRMLGAPRENEHPEEGLLLPAWVGLVLGLICLFNLLLEVFLLFTFINLSPGLRASPLPPSPYTSPPPQFQF